MTEDVSRVTVVVPTFNRSEMLINALESVLAQEYADLQVIVVDDGSTDNTEMVVSAIDDQRLNYVRNPTNMGLCWTWQHGLERSSSPYVCILPDDDAYLPGFIRRSVEMLDANLQAAFSATRANHIDINGQVLPPDQPPDGPASGYLEGLEFLRHVVTGQQWIFIQPAMVMMRSSAIDAVGTLDPRHSIATFDFDLWIRMASKFDVAFIDEELTQVRIHEGQVSHDAYRTARAVGHVGMVAEQMDAAVRLLDSGWAGNSERRKWLCDRLLRLGMRRSQLTAELVPGLNLEWDVRLRGATEKIRSLVQPGDSFILVDADTWGMEEIEGRRAIPFLERDGVYWGDPPDDETAIRELERLRSAGATLMIFGWPAFWWLDYYSGLRRHLEDHYRLIANDSFLVAFRLS